MAQKISPLYLSFKFAANFRQLMSVGREKGYLKVLAAGFRIKADDLAGRDSG
jgi:hypothetical protein